MKVRSAGAVFAIAGMVAACTGGRANAPSSEVRGTPTASSPTTIAAGRLLGPLGARTVGGAAGADTVLAGNDDALFTAFTDNSTGVQTMRRVDPTTGRVLASRAGTHVDGPGEIVAGRLWVLAFAKGTDRLLAFDLHTLATTADIRVSSVKPAGDIQLAGVVRRTSRIYLVYNSNHVAVVDATRQRVVGRYRIAGGDVQAVVDPAGTRMYVVVSPSPPSTRSQRLTVRNPDTGAVLFASDYRTEYGPGLMSVVAASRGGVWIGEGSGMTHFATFHPVDDLDRLTDDRGTSTGGLPLTISVYPNVVWLGSETRVLCADPDTGAVRASVNLGHPGSHALAIDWLTQAGTRLFALYFTRADAQRLVALRPPRRCYG